MVANSDLLRSSEQFDSPDIDLFEVNDKHAKDFLANIVGLFVDSRYFNNLIWCEV